MDKEILDSWEACREAQLERYHPLNLVYCKPKDRQERFKDISYIIDTVHEVLADFKEELKPEDILAVSDKDGWLVDLLNGPMDFLGINCKKEYIGTTAADLCLNTGRAWNVIKDQHYLQFFSNYASFAFPVNVDGHIAAVVVLWILFDSLERYYTLRGMFIMAEKAVNAMVRYGLEQRAEDFINSKIRFPFTIINADGIIEQVDQGIIDLIPQAEEWKGHNYRDIFINHEELPIEEALNHPFWGGGGGSGAADCYNQ